jgi:hypothetical protein
MRNVVARIAASITLVAAAVVAGPTSPAAHAASFHRYSRARDDTASTYSGVKVYRQDLSLSPNPCAFQPIWMTDTSSRTNELGSAYGPSCGGPGEVIPNDTWYWGYQTSSTNFVLGGTRAMTPGQYHYFSIYYYAGYYYFYVDSTLMWDRSYNAFFNDYVQAGLESYDGSVVINGFQDSSLQYTLGGGGWTNWSGEDWHDTITSPMCGSWVSSTDWRAGENATC